MLDINQQFDAHTPWQSESKHTWEKSILAFSYKNTE